MVYSKPHRKLEILDNKRNDGDIVLTWLIHMNGDPRRHDEV